MHVVHVYMSMQQTIEKYIIDNKQNWTNHFHVSAILMISHIAYQCHTYNVAHIRLWKIDQFWVFNKEYKPRSASTTYVLEVGVGCLKQGCRQRLQSGGLAQYTKLHEIMLIPRCTSTNEFMFTVCVIHAPTGKAEK